MPEPPVESNCDRAVHAFRRPILPACVHRDMPGTVKREQVVKLAEGLFDSKHELPLGNGVKLVAPSFRELTPHIREMTLTALLTAEAKEVE